MEKIKLEDVKNARNLMTQKESELSDEERRTVISVLESAHHYREVPGYEMMYFRDIVKEHLE